MRDPVRNSRRAWPLITLLCLGATVAAAQTPSRAGKSQDAATYAAMMGVPLEEAQRRIALQWQLGELEAQLADPAGNIFAGLFIEHQPKFGVKVLFTDTTRGQELIRPMAAALSAPIEVVWAAVALRELEALQEQSLRELRAAGIAVDADIDIRRNRVEIATTRPEEAASLLAPVSSLAGERLMIVPVAELAKPTQLAPMRGGRPLFSCSAGFTARNAAGSVGMLSAGHCSDWQVYWDESVSLPFVSRQLSGSRDVGFYHRACELTALNEFDSGIGIRQVTGMRSRASQVVGSLVCRFGMTTPYRCGTISSKFVCPDYVPSCNSTFMRVEPIDGLPLVAPGDSGSPFFTETLAYGVASGKYQNNNDAIYMAIDYASTTAAPLTTPGGTGFPLGKLTCSGNHAGSPSVQCIASATGGRPPYTLSSWSYYGDAESWFLPYPNQIRALYPFGGCGPGHSNFFGVDIRDVCGVIGGAMADVPCPELSCPEPVRDGSGALLVVPPPYCPVS